MNFIVDYERLNTNRAKYLQEQEKIYNDAKKDVEQQLEFTNKWCISRIEWYYDKHGKLPNYTDIKNFSCCSMLISDKLIQYKDRLSDEFGSKYGGKVILEENRLYLKPQYVMNEPSKIN